MAERDLWDLLQPTWVDQMGGTAWNPPNLPLFEGATWPQAGAAPAYGGGLPAPFSGNSGIPYPLPPEWPNFIPGPNAPQQTLDPEVLGQIVNRFLSRPTSVRNLSVAESALPDVSATADSLQPRADDSGDRGPASYEPTSQYQLAQAQRPAGAGMGEVTPARVPLPRRRPAGAPQIPPVGMSQATPWQPPVSGFNPNEGDQSFDARWSQTTIPNAGPSSLFETSRVPSPTSRHQPIVTSSGTVDPLYIYSYFLDKGLSIPQAAALVGNLTVESRLDPRKLTLPENAKGLAQWHPDRWSDLQKFAASRRTSPYDVNTQLDFILHEMGGSESHNVKDFLVANDVESANNELEKYFRYGHKASKPTRLGEGLRVLGLPWPSSK